MGVLLVAADVSGDIVSSLTHSGIAIFASEEKVMGKGIGSKRLRKFHAEYWKVKKILGSCPLVRKNMEVDTRPFRRRQTAVALAIKKTGFDVGFVFSDEHYNGEVPCLGGNTNISIEQIAGVIGAAGFHVAASFEGIYIAEQLAFRAKAKVHKVEL